MRTGHTSTYNWTFYTEITYFNGIAKICAPVQQTSIQFVPLRQLGEFRSTKLQRQPTVSYLDPAELWENQQLDGPKWKIGSVPEPQTAPHGRASASHARQHVHERQIVFWWKELMWLLACSWLASMLAVSFAAKVLHHQALHVFPTSPSFRTCEDVWVSLVMSLVCLMKPWALARGFLKLVCFSIIPFQGFQNTMQ